MQPNLVDQLEVFLAVAQTGSFSAAGKKLGRAVSAVSYAIANLENQYGLTLFDRTAYRPQLTDDGRALLLDAEIIFRRLDRLNARVAAMKTDNETEIRLTVEARFNRSLLADAIAHFTREFPHINLRLKTVHENQAIEELNQGRAQVGLVTLAPGLTGKGIDGRDLAVTRHHLVSAPDYPLARLAAGFPLSVLDDHPQIIVADYAMDTRTFDYRIQTTDVLIVDSHDMQMELIERGVGWGTAVTHEIAPSIANGTLVELQCSAMAHPGLMRFGAIWMVKTPPGPATTRLLDLIAAIGDAA